MTDDERAMGRTVGQTVGFLIDGNFYSKNDLKLIRKYAKLLIKQEELRSEIDIIKNEILESLGPDYMSEHGISE